MNIHVMLERTEFKPLLISRSFYQRFGNSSFDQHYVRCSTRWARWNIGKDRHLDHRKRLIIAMDVAFGMEYLHSKNIVHFDLKCDNLLVNMKDSSRPICKVGDFGLSKIKRNT
ncbi:putative protein kinase TKL-Pl-6 family [Helianthus annuus]|nr:putative protein kinase TKL-Pl-6 family [Helianthus annuus]KAJ0484610.1 putative protein kinase TKL-Pl-6 family [Helianthus annuus]KAJ0655162.1 putative protein kinase TKL-Pl-6 family [Helianthus annuus]KAJ0658868.1 putative protein kinase TKL-Pl-6 family [Helianthus annuus]KAJ0839097.1 putative protein kinase TKL-Pl-6 family [Helianthus annuus]